MCKDTLDSRNCMPSAKCFCLFNKMWFDLIQNEKLERYSKINVLFLLYVSRET